LGSGNDLPFELGQNRTPIGTGESERIPQVRSGQIVQLVDLV
jgi:hypothetical protein